VLLLYLVSRNHSRQKFKSKILVGANQQKKAIGGKQMDFLKNILSEKTYKTLVEKLGDDLVKQINEKTTDFTVDIAEEKFIPKAKFDEERKTVKDLTDQIKARDTQLAELKKTAIGNEELTAKIKELEEANQKVREEHAKQLLERERDYAIETALMKSGAKNTKAVRAILDATKIEYKDGKLNGLDDQIETLKKSDAYLFNFSTANDEAGRDPKGNKPTNTDEFADFRRLR